MSKAARNPVTVPTGVEVHIKEQEIEVKGSKGKMTLHVNATVSAIKEADKVRFAPKEENPEFDAFVGTMKALFNGMILGVTKGFEKKLTLVGVGYKAQIQGKILVLNIGFSHPIKYKIPVGITIETPTQIDIVIKGVDKHLVGQVAADIRAFRSPEPYKGKGVRYADEVIVLKEGKKK